MTDQAKTPTLREAAQRIIDWETREMTIRDYESKYSERIRPGEAQFLLDNLRAALAGDAPAEPPTLLRAAREVTTEWFQSEMYKNEGSLNKAMLGLLAAAREEM